MQSGLKPTKRYWISLIPYLLLLLLMIGVISMKTNYHVDEVFSYSSSNSIGGLAIQDGVKYEPASSAFDDYVMADSECMFNYKAVWENQAMDVHPPLYYAVLHTVCSFFPGHFSKWFAGAVNIVFCLAALYLFRKLLSLFCSSPALLEIFSVGFALSTGILNNVSFFRMYVMAMFWVTWLSYLYAAQVGKDLDRRFCLQTFLVVLLGGLTHYYCIVYSVLITAAFGVYLLLTRQWKNAGLLCASTAAAGGAACAIFPAMLKHIFSGYRGQEAFENLASSDYWVRLKSFCDFIDKQLFGGILIVILLALLLLFFFRRRMAKLASSEEAPAGSSALFWLRFLILLFSVLTYFLLISKIAAYITDRYLFPIYAVSLLLVAALTAAVLEKGFSAAARTVLACLLVGIISIGSWMNASWTYLYLNANDFLQTASRYSDADCICIYDAGWKLRSVFLESRNYKSITFVNKEETELLTEIMKENDHPVVLCLLVDDDPLVYVDGWLEQSDCLNTNTEVGSCNSAISYYLYSE